MPSADAYWLALRQVRGVGPRISRVLLDQFGTPEQIFGRSPQEIASAGVPMGVARALVDFKDFDPLDRQLCELPPLGARLVRWTDGDYPPNLRQIGDPPPYLFVRGDAPLKEPRCIAIVGARAASDAGLRMAGRLAFELAARQFIVVSGLARGVDGAAHQGALDAGGRTIAVMGCGIDVIYPPEHRKLADSIVDQGGALISELPVGTQPYGDNFPARNRILSGLCLGAVIVEAAEKSGSLITARMALEQNRQVFAVPGSPLSGKARGSNRLIKEGAVLVDSVEDVIEELAQQLGPVKLTDGKKAGDQSRQTSTKSAVSDASGRIEHLRDLGDQTLKDAKAIVQSFKDDQKLHIDAIIESSGLDARVVLRLLLEMELRGIVAQHPGKLFSLA